MEDGLFSDFEQEVYATLEKEAARMDVLAPTTTIPSPIPISGWYTDVQNCSVF